MNRLQHNLAATALALFCLCYSVASPGQLSQTQVVATANGSIFDLDLSSISHFDRATVTLENIGDLPVVMPEASPAGAAPDTDSQAILSWLQMQGASSDRALAEAAWHYVNDRMLRQCFATSPFEGYSETRIPWRLLRGYGFGCCDQDAFTLSWLFHLEGFQSRVVTLPGHVVAEINYANAWHMYDSDHRVYYTNVDGSVADVAQVMADPTLVATGADANGLDPVGWTTADMESLYANAHPIYTIPRWTDSWWDDPVFSLGPGETLLLYSDNIISDLIYGGTESVAPALADSATLIRPVDFSDSHWMSRIFTVSGMDVNTTEEGTALTNTSSRGTVVLKKDWPSPTYSEQFDGEFYRTGDSSIRVYFSTDGLSWSQPFPIIVPPGKLESASLSLTKVARGAYLSYVMVEVVGDPGSVRISSLKLTSNVQIAKSSFPALTPATVNHLIYRDGSPDAQERDISVRVAVYNDPAAPVGMKVAKSQDETVGLEATVGELEGFLRAPLTFYPWLAYGGSTASQELWQEQQSGSVLQAVAANASNYLVMGAAVSWDHSDDGPTTWAVAKREPASLNFDWLEAPQSTNWFGAMTLAISSPGDQLILSTSHGGKVDLLGRPIYQKVTTTSLVAEDPIYSIAAGYGAAHLTDGNLRSLAYPGSPQFDYEMDLGGVAHVSAVGLNWGYFGTNPLFIQSWTLYGRRSQMDAWQVLQQGGFPGKETTTAELDTEVSQLRIAATSSHWIGMFEVSVAASVPLALSATSNVAEMTGVQSYGPASRLVDGNDNTLAYPGSIYNDYTLDPGSSSYIDEVRIVWGYFGSDARYVKSWRLYGQKQIGTTWDIITGGGSPNASISVIPVHNDYRRLRIAAESVHWIGIYEMTVYGNLLR